VLREDTATKHTNFACTVARVYAIALPEAPLNKRSLNGNRCARFKEALRRLFGRMVSYEKVIFVSRATFARLLPIAALRAVLLLRERGDALFSIDCGSESSAIIAGEACRGTSDAAPAARRRPHLMAVAVPEVAN
jgi:hypothetical protein